MSPGIDLNADLGEGCGDDAALLGLVTSANVACGFHAGDRATMATAGERALALGVRIGAHVGYGDRAGFGRRELGLSSAEIADQVAEQVGVLRAIVEAVGGHVSHVKPHGALYHRAGRDEACAEAIAAAIARLDPALIVLSAPDDALVRAARRHGLATIGEGFADRAYRRDGALVARDLPGGVLDVPAAVAQALSIARHGQARTAEGTAVAVAAQSLCVHGDTPGAVELARAVHDALTDAGVDVRAFA